MTNREKRWLRSQGIDPVAVQEERMKRPLFPTLEEAYTAPMGRGSVLRAFTFTGPPGTRYEVGQEVFTGQGYAYVVTESFTIGEDGKALGNTVLLQEMRQVRPDVAQHYDRRKIGEANARAILGHQDSSPPAVATPRRYGRASLKASLLMASLLSGVELSDENS